MKKEINKLSALLLITALSISSVACGNKNTELDIESSISLSETDSVVNEDNNTNETSNQVLDINFDYLDSNIDIEKRIDCLIEQMTVEEKVGQIIQAEQGYISPEEVSEYNIGSVLSGGGSAPQSGNSLENWNARLTEIKDASKNTRLQIPVLYGIDAVHGNNNINGATIFPHNIGLGAANDPELMEKIGAITASEVKASGADWTFAPCIGNPQDISWGRTYETFSENADDIGPLISSLIAGLQENGIIACAKHFIGEGYTTDGINQGNVAMSSEEFDALLSSGILDPYKCAIDANVLTVMASYNSVDGVKCHENYHLLTEVLKGELGFNGLVVGDYNAVAQLSGGSYAKQLANCVNAGVDLLMEPDNWKNAYKELIKDVNDGSITKERLNDAVRRNLRVKFVAGLFDNNEDITADTDEYGSSDHREVAREAVRKSLVLLKNENVGNKTAIEALQDVTHLSVSGQKAFDMGSQCGGWTISWQGMTGNKNVMGTPVIQGFANAIKDKCKITHSVDGSLDEETNGVVVVFGENPYAESDGDRNESLPLICSSDAEMLDALRPNLEALDKNIPVVAVIIAGRPVDISAYEDMFDAVVMAWLPGSEGDGIADVLFGEYDFTGTTKFTWGTSYPYGHGLSKSGNQILR